MKDELEDMFSLAEDDTWKQYSENWKRHRADFDNRLRERNLQASPDRVLEISLEGIEEAGRHEIVDKLEDPLGELLAACLASGYAVPNTLLELRWAFAISHI